MYVALVTLTEVNTFEFLRTSVLRLAQLLPCIHLTLAAFLYRWLPRRTVTEGNDLRGWGRTEKCLPREETSVYPQLIVCCIWIYLGKPNLKDCSRVSSIDFSLKFERK